MSRKSVSLRINEESFDELKKLTEYYGLSDYVILCSLINNVLNEDNRSIASELIEKDIKITKFLIDMVNSINEDGE